MLLLTQHYSKTAKSCNTAVDCNDYMAKTGASPEVSRTYVQASTSMLQCESLTTYPFI